MVFFLFPKSTKAQCDVWGSQQAETQRERGGEGGFVGRNQGEAQFKDGLHMRAGRRQDELVLREDAFAGSKPAG